MKKIKILHFINSLNYGGAERFLLNLLQNINKEKYHFDIIVRNKSNLMSKDFEELGARIIKAPDFPKNTYKHYKFMKNFIVNEGEKYDFIHVHANSLIYTLPFSMFNKYTNNVDTLLHSHSSQSENKLVTLFHKINRKKHIENIDKKIAVSKLSGKWMFGNQDYETIYNGIDIKKNLFNQKDRNVIRNEFNVKEEEVLLGSVGRLVSVKNYNLLLQILKQLSMKKSSTNYKLILVGKGELEEKLKQQVNSYDIGNQVIFAGQRDDVPAILSAMDIYLQPSHFEGFPFSVIEAQVANLPTIISDTITDEVKISNDLFFANNENIDEWIKIINDFSDYKLDRFDESKVESNLVDMKNIAKRFENIYW